jgi:putative two-component system response regulator
VELGLALIALSVHHTNVARILVADDDALIRRFLEQALIHGQYEVDLAGDGLEAIAKLDGGEEYEVLVTDYAMPKATGIDVIRHAQKINPMLPCIIVTAFRDLDLAMRGMAAGAVGFIPKPFKADHLLMVVQRARERRELELETTRLRLLAPMLERFTLILASTLESRDPATQRHSERLVQWTDVMAQQLGVSPDQRGRMRLGASLHDIGKVAVPEWILTKAGPLNADEFAQIKEHPVVGAAILESIDSWADVRLIVRHHHEHFDGSGYPKGLHGEQIPLGARVVAVADAFDVMKTGRPYAVAKSLDEIAAEMKSQSGRQFDPEVIEAFMLCLEGFHK